MKVKLSVSILIGVIGFAMMISLGTAAENRGAENMVLEGGSQGAVPFPHYSHQSRLGDCQVCHALFPQEAGSIQKLKAEGQLVGKKVMNTQCIKCHRTEKRAGNPSGPTSCTQCHQKV